MLNNSASENQISRKVTENYFFSKTISINGLIFNNWCEFATSSVHLLQKDVLAETLKII